MLFYFLPILHLVFNYRHTVVTVPPTTLRQTRHLAAETSIMAYFFDSTVIRLIYTIALCINRGLMDLELGHR